MVVSNQDLIIETIMSLRVYDGSWVHKEEVSWDNQLDMICLWKWGYLAISYRNNGQWREWKTPHGQTPCRKMVALNTTSICCWHHVMCVKSCWISFLLGKSSFLLITSWWISHLLLPKSPPDRCFYLTKPREAADAAWMWHHFYEGLCLGGEASPKLVNL
jgi:hypothetical protein